MKFKTMMPGIMVSTLLLSMSLVSCQKESVSTPQTQQQVADENAEITQTVDAATGTTQRGPPAWQAPGATERECSPSRPQGR